MMGNFKQHNLRKGSEGAFKKKPLRRVREKRQRRVSPWSEEETSELRAKLVKRGGKEVRKDDNGVIAVSLPGRNFRTIRINRKGL